LAQLGVYRRGNFRVGMQVPIAGSAVITIRSRSGTSENPYPIAQSHPGGGLLNRARSAVRRFVSLAFFVTALAISPVFAVTVRAGQATSVKGHQVAIAPSPRHDISGTWEPANGPADGIQPIGVKAMPADGKPEHELPYTPLGLATFNSHKAQEGVNEVLSASNNDPRDKCEPLGFPRADFLGLRQTQIMEDKYKVAILYENGETWRVIWIDGRELPKVVEGAVMVGNEFREQRYYGYSVGKWVDDTTLVVQTVGTMGDDKVWMDSAGRPVSDALRVEERFHRVDHDHLELTATIDDPKMYTRPWVAMNKFPMKLQDPHTDVMEMYCSPSEIERFNKLIGDPSSGPGNKAPER
jgi:hypothetical protein